MRLIENENLYPNFRCSVNDEKKHLGESATFPQTLKLVYYQRSG